MQPRSEGMRTLALTASATAVTAVCITLAACGATTTASSATHAASASRPSLTEHQILSLALSAATRAGDARPTLIQHAEGTREAANGVDSGDIVPGDGWSYLIAIRGRFVLTDASYPAGARPPKGTVLTLIVAARTDHVTDGGVSDRYPHLATLGPVTTDLRRG